MVMVVDSDISIPLKNWDANGNTIQSSGRTFAYNETNRMNASTNGAATSNYTYNARGQRSIKVSGGVETHYIFNASGQLIAEANGIGEIQKEYVYSNGQPYAQVIGSDIYYYHNSHLGTPEMMTDSNQAIVWQASYSPFGKADISVELVENNIRFPGQYFDSESGLHYNYFRDYDPEIGRYIQSDPIGLAGGINTYGYVGGNPVNYIDPLGLRITDVVEIMRTIETNIPDISFGDWGFDDDIPSTALGHTDVLTGTIGLNPKFKECLSSSSFNDLYRQLLHEGMHSSDNIWERYVTAGENNTHPHHMAIYNRVNWETGSNGLLVNIPDGRTANSYRGQSHLLPYSGDLWGIGYVEQLGSGRKASTFDIGKLYDSLYPNGQEGCECDQ